MSVKCPRCGFESAEGADWCDFCKEPFRRSKAPPVPAPAPAGRPPAARAPGGDELPEDVLARLEPALRQARSEDQLPAPPPWARVAAWAFLAVCSAAALTTAFLLAKRAPRP